MVRQWGLKTLWKVTIDIFFLGHHRKANSSKGQLKICCSASLCFRNERRIMSRYVKFFAGLRSSASYEVQVLARFLARDIRSVTGKNLSQLAEVSNLNPWCANQDRVKMALISAELVEVPPMDSWRLPYLWSLLAQKREAHTLALDEKESRLDELIRSLVMN